MSTSTARRVAVVAAMACGALFATSSARASNVNWSIGINAPIYPGEISTVISNGPYYAPPPPVYVQPAPVYYYGAPPVYVRPAPVVVYPRGPAYYGHWHHPRYHDRWHDGYDRWRDPRDPRGHDGWRR